MIYKLPLMVTIIMTSFCFSQELESEIPLDLKMTDAFNDNRKFTDLSFSTKDNSGGVYVGRRYNKGYYIEHFDTNLNIVNKYDIEVLKNRGNIENAFLSGNSLCLIESYYDKGEKQLKYFTNTTQLGQNSFERKLLFSVPLDDIRKPRFMSGLFGEGRDEDSDVLGNFMASKNSEYVAFIIDIKNKEIETHRIYVFNNALELIYNTEFERSLRDRKFVLQNVDIDQNSGAVYLLGKSFAKNKQEKKEGGKYQFELYKIEMENTSSLVFDSSDKFIGSLTTVVNDNQLFCVGFYSEKNDKRYKGLAYFNVDYNTMTLANSEYSPFTSQFILDKYGKSKEKELRHIDFKSIHLTEKNECIINAEEFYITQTSSGGQYGGSYSTLNYRDIISAKFSPEGKLEWARNINKTQRSNKPDRYLSYTSTYHNGLSYFFINCSDKIKKLSNNRIEFKSKRTSRPHLHVITINENGDFEYKKIIDAKEADVSFEAGEGLLINDGKDVIFQGRRGKNKQILKISLE